MARKYTNAEISAMTDAQLAQLIGGQAPIAKPAGRGRRAVNFGDPADPADVTKARAEQQTRQRGGNNPPQNPPQRNNNNGRRGGALKWLVIGLVGLGAMGTFYMTKSMDIDEAKDKREWLADYENSTLIQNFDELTPINNRDAQVIMDEHKKNGVAKDYRIKNIAGGVLVLHKDEDVFMINGKYFLVPKGHKIVKSVDANGFPVFALECSDCEVNTAANSRSGKFKKSTQVVSDKAEKEESKKKEGSKEEVKEEEQKPGKTKTINAKAKDCDGTSMVVRFRLANEND